MATIRQDKHGLYVVTNGSVYRPVWTESTYTSYAHVAYTTSERLAKSRAIFAAMVTGSKHKAGDVVTARAVAGTERATINGKSGESWMKHNTAPPYDKSATSEHHWSPRKG